MITRTSNRNNSAFGRPCETKRLYKAAAKAALVVAIAVGVNSGENWRIRIAAVVLFLVGFILAFTPMVVSRRFSFMQAKFGGRRGQVVRFVGEIIARVCFAALVIYISGLLLRIASDLYDVLRIGTPRASDASIVHEYSDGLTWWAWKGVDLMTTDGKTARYELLFHPRRLEVGGEYRVIILPKSRCALAFTPLK